MNISPSVTNVFGVDATLSLSQGYGSDSQSGESEFAALRAFLVSAQHFAQLQVVDPQIQLYDPSIINRAAIGYVAVRPAAIGQHLFAPFQ